MAGEDGGFDDLDVIFFLSLSVSFSPSLVVANTKVPGAEMYILQQKHFHFPREALEGSYTRSF